MDKHTFSRDINIEWKHGIPQIHPDNTVSNPEGRISIIVGVQFHMKNLVIN